MRHPIVRSMSAIALAVMGLPSFASAAYIDVFGGPTYTPGVGGFQTGPIAVHAPPYVGVNSAGTAFGNLSEYDASDVLVGFRAIRWDASGAAPELGNLSAFAINNSGTIVGSGSKFDDSTFKGSRAVRWDSTGAVVELGTLGTGVTGVTESSALAVNSAGAAVGVADKYNSSGVRLGDRAVRWDASGTAATELGNLGTNPQGETSSRALAINDAGTAVGAADKYNASGVRQGYRAVRWGVSGTDAVELGNLGLDANGQTNTDAVAINGAGIAVGSAEKYDSSGAYQGSRAVRWDAAGNATELGILGSGPDGFNGAGAINGAGTAIGSAAKYDASGVYQGQRAVRWYAGSTVATELGNLGTRAGDGRADNFARAINGAGTAVGEVELYNGEDFLRTTAVYWGADGVPIDLNTLIDPASGWTLTYATAISDTNWVSGVGTYDPDGPGGQDPYGRLFLIHVPEPSGFGLLGLAGFALLRRRGRCLACFD
jgi:hypothetical protein